MAIESQAGILAASLARAPDVTKGQGNGFAGLFSGIASGMKVQGAQNEADEKQFAETGSRPSFADRVKRLPGNLASAFMGAPAEQARAADPLSAVKEKVFQQKAAMQELELIDALDRRDSVVRNKVAVRELSNAVRDILKTGDPTDPSSRAQILEWMSRNPGALNDPSAQAVLKEFGTARTIKMEQNRILGIGNQAEAMQRAGVQSFNPESGSMSLADTATSGPLSQKGKEIADFNSLVSRGDTEGAAMMRAQMEADGFNMQFGEDGKLLSISKGPAGRGGGGLTPSQSGVLVQQAAKLTDTTRKISEIVPLADKIFGPLAAGQSVVVDRMLANLVPGLAEGQRIQGRAQAAAIINGVIQQLGEGQGQLSNRDVERYEKIVPEIKEMAEMLESPENARQLMLFLQKEISRDAYTKHGLIGKPPPVEVLSGLDPDFLVEEVQAGRLTPDQLEEALMKSLHTDEIMKALSNLKNQK